MTTTADRMDAIYASQRHIYDLSRKYFLLGRDDLIARLDVPDDGTVLEIGCGTGRNLIAAARRYPTARLYGLDISSAMLATARSETAKARLGSRILLAQGDACDFDTRTLFGKDRFDRVFMSYTLSMIPEWKAALEQGVQVTAGVLSLVDFGQQERLPRAFRALLHAWLAKFDVVPRATLPDVLRTLAAANDMHLWFDRLFRDYAWAAELRRSGSSM